MRYHRNCFEQEQQQKPVSVGSLGLVLTNKNFMCVSVVNFFFSLMFKVLQFIRAVMLSRIVILSGRESTSINPFISGMGWGRGEHLWCLKIRFGHWTCSS